MLICENDSRSHLKPLRTTQIFTKHIKLFQYKLVFLNITMSFIDNVSLPYSNYQLLNISRETKKEVEDEIILKMDKKK